MRRPTPPDAAFSRADVTDPGATTARTISDPMKRSMRQTSSLAALALAGIVLTAPAAANPVLVFDLSTGQVLEQREALKRWYPASLSKLMTAYVAFRAVKAGELTMTSPITVTKHSAAEPPSKMGYKPGSVMTLDNALKMMLIKSANDIAMAVGENVGGSQKAFAERMNAEAQRLGMTGSHFVNPNGLHDDRQYTTARDLALLATAIRKEFPQHAHYFGIEGLAAGKQKLPNYNQLIGRYAGADGMKTGFVCASGFNLVGSATRDGRTIMAVVLGEQSAVTRTVAAAQLLDKGFAIHGAGRPVVAALASSDPADSVPTNMRQEICERKPASAQSESGDPQSPEKSPWQTKLANPKLVAVGLGGADGPIPAALGEAGMVEYADVPLPTWRPDMPPPAGAAPIVQGDRP